MNDTPRVLIVGAGWRVATFVVPALRALGLDGDRINILRRSQAELGARFEGVTRVAWDRLEPAYDLTINCVAEEALVEVQSKLVDRFPNAIHFCDTPIVHRLSEVARARFLARRGRLYSLEDWPRMPNLGPVFDLLSDHHPSAALRFEHIGIDTHFLAAARSAWRRVGSRSPRLAIHRRGDLLVWSRHAMSASRSGRKDYGRAKILIWNGSALVEDFFGVRPAPGRPSFPEDGEVVSREIDGDRVRYLLGGRAFDEVDIPRAVSGRILKEQGRQAVHELDKCVALIRILGSALEGRPEAYRYLDSLADTCVAWWARRARIAPVW